MDKKIFILDTNVILSEPKALLNFQDNIVIIPMVVIEEIDKFKKDTGQLGYSARNFSREIDKLRTKGSLIDGVATENGGIIQIVQFKTKQLMCYELDLSINDNIILATACKIRDDENNSTNNVTLVSRDVNVRIKGDIMGLNTETYTTDSVNFSNLSKGFRTLLVNGDIISEIYNNGYVDIDRIEDLEDKYPNEYFLFKNKGDNQNQVIVRYSEPKNQQPTFVRIKEYKGKKNKVAGINARNIEQTIAVDMLLNPSIQLVSLIGAAGTGKTLLAIASGIREVIEDGKYNKLTVARPIFPMGNDIGYLPGTIEEKLTPWTQPIIDNLEYILVENNNYLSGVGKYDFKNVSELLESEFLQVEALTYIRGRSIPNQFIIIDESQNLNAFEIKTIISRAGEGTKIILTGDPYQIDNPYLTKENNGLIYTMDRLKNSPLTGHIVLEKGERSELADLAVKQL